MGQTMQAGGIRLSRSLILKTEDLSGLARVEIYSPYEPLKTFEAELYCGPNPTRFGEMQWQELRIQGVYG